MTHQRRGLVFLAVAVAGATLAAAPLAGAASPPTVKVKARSYSKVFKVVSCVNKGETDINLTGKAAGGDQPLRLRIVGKYRSGTLSIRGDIILNGKLTSVTVGDAGNIKIKGKFTGPNLKSSFTVTGRCA